MLAFVQKIPFLMELFINGFFILLFSLKALDKTPQAWNSAWVESSLSFGAHAVPFVIFIQIISNYVQGKGIEDFFRKHVFSLIVFIPVVMTWGDAEFAYWLCSAHLLSSILSLYDEDVELNEFETRIEKRRSWWGKLRLKPAQMILLSFSGLICVGTFLLMLPVSSETGQAISGIDALFLATSATCVTGLSTLDVHTTLSLFGEVVLLILMQVGGLSIMTLYASVVIMLGRSLRMRDRVVIQDLLDVSSAEELFSMILSIIKYTLTIELWGAIILTVGFSLEGFEFGEAMYFGIFHAVSAFCNAGFSLFSTSLESFSTSPIINWTVMILITLGGLGFIVLKELGEIITFKRHLHRITLHTRIVLGASALLTFGGAVFFFFSEFLGALDGLTLWGKMQASLFQSVTLRTAGFNTIPLSQLNIYTVYAMTLFMFIGGGPGSTAGGIKVTTLAILFHSIKTTLGAGKNVVIHDRKIPQIFVVKATAITFISILVASFFILLMLRIEPGMSFISIFFESVSASATVGLSLGITADLSIAGKAAIAFLMLVGRIGPLTLVLAIGQKYDSRGKFDYPDGRIMIG